MWGSNVRMPRDWHFLGARIIISCAADGNLGGSCHLVLDPPGLVFPQEYKAVISLIIEDIKRTPVRLSEVQLCAGLEDKRPVVS